MVVRCRRHPLNGRSQAGQQPANTAPGVVDADDPAEMILRQVMASAHSRLPVFRGERDNILGVVHAKDLWRESDRLAREGEAPDTLDILRVAMKPYFIPDTTSLDEQMREFLKRRTHFALVVDEYGDITGIVTINDVMGAVIGRLQTSEHYDKEPMVVVRDDGTRKPPHPGG